MGTTRACSPPTVHAPRPLLRLLAGVPVPETGSSTWAVRPGTITVDLARSVQPGVVEAINNEPVMLLATRELTRAYGLDNVWAVHDDAARPPWPEATVDFVDLHLVLQHVTDRGAVLAECRRVVDDRGIVAARDADSGTSSGALRIETSTAGAVCDAAAWTAGGEPNAGRYLLWCADEVGLSYSQASANVWLFITAKDHAWWGGSWAERALQSGWAHATLEAGTATVGELAASATPASDDQKR